MLQRIEIMKEEVKGLDREVPMYGGMVVESIRQKWLVTAMRILFCFSLKLFVLTDGLGALAVYLFIGEIWYGIARDAKMLRPRLYFPRQESFYAQAVAVGQAVEAVPVYDGMGAM